MRNDHVKGTRKGMIKLSPNHISNVQERMTEEKENINHFENQELHAPQKRHPMPLPMDLFSLMKFSKPDEPKVLASKGKHVECQGSICQKITQDLNTTMTDEPKEAKSKTLIEKATKWITGIRFNIYHLVFHLIRELEKSLYRREQEKKNQISE